MSANLSAYRQITEALQSKGATLVAVSKTKPVGDIQELYQAGHRDFGENYVQELMQKQTELPVDIRWHFIGHLQSNKVKYIAPFVHLIHGVDSARLLQEIQKQGNKLQKKIQVLLQVHIAREETKFGFDEAELMQVIEQAESSLFTHVVIRGLMGMASFTENQEQVRAEFHGLRSLFDKIRSRQSSLSDSFDTLSMGMSGDFGIALEEGSTMVRIGSLLFGAREYQQK